MLYTVYTEVCYTHYRVNVNADRSDNNETLLKPIFITLTKTRQQNEEYNMVKLQVKTDNIQ